jgi:hypothetical protein
MCSVLPCERQATGPQQSSRNAGRTAGAATHVVGLNLLGS